jgi:hypothetical protein
LRTGRRKGISDSGSSKEQRGPETKITGAAAELAELDRAEARIWAEWIHHCVIRLKSGFDGSESRLTSQFLLAMHPWAISMALSFLICKMGLL